MSVSLQPPTSPRTPQRPTVPRKDEWTPAKSYPLSRSPESKRIRILFTPNGKQSFQQPGIYRFRHREDDKRYIGQSCDLKHRMEQHRSSFKSPQSPFEQAVAATPESFEVGIVRSASEDALDTLEKQAIKAKRSIQNGYNRREGGGGGKSQPKTKIAPELFTSALETFKNAYTEPKEYPFTRIRGKLRAQLPEKEAKMRFQIYDIIERTKEKTVHYPGYTTTALAVRIQGYCTRANNPNKYPKPLFRAMNDHPERFHVACIDTSCIADIPLQIREQIIIQALKDKGEAVRNSNRGGGGGWCKS